MERIGKKVVEKAVLVCDQSVIFVTLTGFEILESKSTNALDVVYTMLTFLSYNISQTNT